MAKIFCIDQGNTRTKWAIVEDGYIVIASEKRLSNPEVLELCDEHEVDGIGISTVTDQIDEDTFGHKYPIIFIDSNTRLPIPSAYTSEETLGSDRIAIACAAEKKYPQSPVLAISLGTCITYNYVSDRGIFRGGAISPGMYMRAQAMHKLTGKLPMVEPKTPPYLVGYDTVSSMQAGIHFGMVDEIDGMIDRYREEFTNINAILTGGDADFFASKLKNEIFVDSNLIYKGIYAIAEYNL